MHSDLSDSVVLVLQILFSLVLVLVPEFHHSFSSVLQFYIVLVLVLVPQISVILISISS